MDASVWVSRFILTDVHHVASEAWLRDHLRRGYRIIAPTLLLVEVAGAIGRRTGDARHAEQIVRLLHELPGLQWISLSGEIRDHAAAHALALRLRGADAVYVALADRLKIPLITWDDEQLTRTRSRIDPVTPEAAAR